METNNIAIGENAALSATNTINCVFIGINAGKEITEGDGIIIIGDDIVNLDKSQSNVVFIGEKVAIGKTIFGEPINLRDVFIKLKIGDYNQAIGSNTMNDTTIGSEPGQFGDKGPHNTAFGSNPSNRIYGEIKGDLTTNLSPKINVKSCPLLFGVNSIAIGYDALKSTNTGNSSIAIGRSASGTLNCDCGADNCVSKNK